MRIYTRTGDDGTTGLFGGARTTKADVRVDAYGTFDEANAVLGVARASGTPPAVDRLLEVIQSDLFTLGAELACAPGAESKLKLPRIGKDRIEWLERSIDAEEAQLAPLRQFIVPGGSAAAAALHQARCVVRRGERMLVRAAAEHTVRSELIAYANRLSDLLFVLARRTNDLAGVGETLWQPDPGSGASSDE